MEANLFLDEVRARKDNLALLFGKEAADKWEREIMVNVLRNGGFE